MPLCVFAKTEGGDAEPCARCACEKRTCEHGPNVSAIVLMSALQVRSSFTPECSACREQADPTRSLDAAVSKAPQPSFSLNRIPLHASGWISKSPLRLKRNEAILRRLSRCWMAKKVNPILSNACAKKVLDSRRPIPLSAEIRPGLVLVAHH